MIVQVFLRAYTEDSRIKQLSPKNLYFQQIQEQTHYEAFCLRDYAEFIDVTEK